MWTCESGCLIFELLKRTQQYYLPKLCKIDTINHKKLTLEMFAKCSSTGESRMQIRVAKLNYEKVSFGGKVRAKGGAQLGFFFEEI